MSTFVPPIAGDPLSPAVPARPARRVGALWRRVLAFFIDTIIIGLPVDVVAWVFFDKFSQLGAWGRLVGFCLALPYFAILDSSIGNGQTLGKRWMHVRVVDADGNPIPFGKALLRYVVFAAPWFLNGLMLPANETSAAMWTLIGLIVFGVGGTTFYLMCFNRRTRQGLHDLVVGSYVADAEVPGPVSVQPIWKMHWAIIGVMVAVISVAGVVLSKKFNAWGTMSQLLDDMRVVQALPGVQSVGAQATVWGSSSKHVLVIKVFLDRTIRGRELRQQRRIGGAYARSHGTEIRFAADLIDSPIRSRDRQWAHHEDLPTHAGGMECASVESVGAG